MDGMIDRTRYGEVHMAATGVDIRMPNKLAHAWSAFVIR